MSPSLGGNSEANIAYIIIGSCGGVVVLAAVIAVVIVRRKIRLKSKSSAITMQSFTTICRSIEQQQSQDDIDEESDFDDAEEPAVATRAVNTWTDAAHSSFDDAIELTHAVH